MEFRWHDLDADRHTICASRPGCGPNDLRFCHSKGSALRRVQRNLLERHMALGWAHVTVDAGDTTASPFRCHGADAFSRSKWQGRPFWRVRRPLLSTYHVAVGRFGLDAVISVDCSVCSLLSSGWHEYVHGTGCYVWWSGGC